MIWSMRAASRLGLAVVMLLILFAGALGGRQAGPAHAQGGDPRYFPQTGYRIGDDAFFDYFTHRGGIPNFGYPTSESFTLLGFRVQFFQRRVMQMHPDGTVGLLNLLDAGILPYTRFNGSTFPGVDAGLTAAAPAPNSANYAQAALAFVTAHAPDSFNGLPVRFGATFLSSVSAADAFPGGQGNNALLPLLDLELWGLPTSAPTPDPANGKFIYLRFQRGIMQFDAGSGLTQGILLADYLKAIMTAPGAPGALPIDLAQEAAGSPYLNQFAPGQPQFLARPSDLPNSDLTNAFYPQTESGKPLAPTATPVPPPTPTPIGDYCVGDEKMMFAGAGSATIGDTVSISVTSSRNHTNVVLTGPDMPTFVKQYAGQEGQVWVYQVTLKSGGRHDYTFYVDTTVVCTTNYFVSSGPTATPAPTNTAGPTPTPGPTATPTPGPQPHIAGVDQTSIYRGQVVTISGSNFGTPPPGNVANGTVTFYLQGQAQTGDTRPTSGDGVVQSWNNTAISVQVPTNLAAPASGSYCVQVTVINAQPATSNSLCNLQLLGS